MQPTAANNRIQAKIVKIFFIGEYLLQKKGFVTHGYDFFYVPFMYANMFFVYKNTPPIYANLRQSGTFFYAHMVMPKNGLRTPTHFEA